MAEFLYTYEKYGMEILGVVLVVLFVLQCIQLQRIHKLRKQLTRMAGRAQLRDEMGRMDSRRTTGNLRSRAVQRVPEMQEAEMQDAGMYAAGVRRQSVRGAEEGRDAGHLSEDQSQLISEVLGEIFP